jgi:hypothetical protein
MSAYDKDSLGNSAGRKASRDHADRVAQRPPNGHLVAETGELRPGARARRGLRATGPTRSGSLRADGRFTAVDFAATALELWPVSGAGHGPDVRRSASDWIQADLAIWDASAGARSSSVVCVYVHMVGSVAEMVREWPEASLAAGPCSWSAIARSTRPRATTAAAGQVQVSIEAAVAALVRTGWQLARGR